MTATLHNMAHIALNAQDPEKAVKLWSEAFDLAMKRKMRLDLFTWAGISGFFWPKTEIQRRAKSF